MFITLFPLHITDLLRLKAARVGSFHICRWPRNIHSLTQFECRKVFYFICWEEAGKHDSDSPFRLHSSFSMHKQEKVLLCIEGKKNSNPQKGNISLPILYHFCCSAAIAQICDQYNYRSFTLAILSSDKEDGINAIKLLLSRKVDFCTSLEEGTSIYFFLLSHSSSVKFLYSIGSQHIVYIPTNNIQYHFLMRISIYTWLSN